MAVDVVAAVAEVSVEVVAVEAVAVASAEVVAATGAVKKITDRLSELSRWAT